MAPPPPPFPLSSPLSSPLHAPLTDPSEHEGLLAHTNANSDPIELRPLRKSTSSTSILSALALDPDSDSPYPEVRAAVKNTDEDLPCNTMRAWTIGLLLVVVGASMNTLFSLRAPSIKVTSLLAQVVAYPVGHAWARWMPQRQFRTYGHTWSLNPGAFNVKEHAVIVVMASVSFSVAYATDIILAQRIFYGQNFGIPWQLMLTISSQSVGYGIAGMLRKFLVYPAAMIWPGNLSSVTLMNAMYESKFERDSSFVGGSIPRYRWFFIVVMASFVYYFVPTYLFKFLSTFSFMTWIWPQNVIINQLFGEQNGLSLFPITFDLSQITGFVGNPLVYPWAAIFNTIIGVWVFYIFITGFLHFTNTWYAHYLPISDSGTYDNTGHKYNTTRVLTPEMRLDEAEYKKYSPLFISSTFAMAYGMSFAAISSVIMHTWIHNRHQIIAQWTNSNKERPDIHMRLMRKYPEAPGWWYGSLFALMMTMGMYCLLAYPTNFEWWAFLLAVSISFAFALPIGIIQAVTNNQIGLNVLTEFVYGYIQPGRPLGLMLFKTYGYICMAQALNFTSDLKFGHYMKIPPRTMFLSQVAATTLACIVQIATLNLSLATIPSVCDPTQQDHFTCPGGRVFFSASVIWGLIGPARMFSPGQVYAGLFWFFPLGAVTPVILAWAEKKWPHSFAKNLIAPIIFAGGAAIPPATPLNYLSWGTMGYIFQYYIRKVHFRWWERLNFLTASGLDLGLAFGTLVAFFAFTIRGIEAPDWWGNNIGRDSLDNVGGATLKTVNRGETFGPKSW